MIKNIIFDFDGVLVDSEILAAKAFAKYMKKYDIEIDENEFANFAGKKTVQVIDIFPLFTHFSSDCNNIIVYRNFSIRIIKMYTGSC